MKNIHEAEHFAADPDTRNTEIKTKSLHKTGLNKTTPTHSKSKGNETCSEMKSERNRVENSGVIRREKLVSTTLRGRTPRSEKI